MTTPAGVPEEAWLAADEGRGYTAPIKPGPVPNHESGHDDVYVVERLLAKREGAGTSTRRQRPTPEYFVVWWGWPKECGTWEPEFNLIGTDVAEMAKHL